MSIFINFIGLFSGLTLLLIAIDKLIILNDLRWKKKRGDIID